MSPMFHRGDRVLVIGEGLPILAGVVHHWTGSRCSLDGDLMCAVDIARNAPALAGELVEFCQSVLTKPTAH